MSRLTQLLAALTAAMLLVAAAPAGAQQPQSDSASAQAQRQETQPLNNAPVWREVRSGSPGVTDVRGVETGVLVQSGGETWRQVREPIAFWGGVVVAFSVLGLALAHLVLGPLTPGDAPPGRLIRRFSAADRHAHWLLAICWVTLAITGLILSLGKTVLLPVLGYTVFAWLASMAKTVHNFTGPILIVAIPWLFIRFVRDNRIGIEDIKWLLHLPGLYKGHFYPSHRFNAGEKVQFWIVLVLLSTVLSLTGLILVFPNIGQGRATMQISSTIHMTAAYLAIAISLLHVYLGTMGVTGAYSAMRYGYVDEAWAKHHHDLWYQDVVAGKARESFAQPGEGPPEEARQPGKVRPA
jgi:formate dehydrogenase subunit gamma